LSVLSHMFDCELFGLNPGGHHFTSLFIHAANAALLFLVLNAMTGATWKSAFVAALFALHPLNVESVAWVAERRNVLSTFFWLLTMAAYVLYIRHPNLLRYISIVFCFILGLLSKQMLVTLPFALLLLDYWPLNRFSDCSGEPPIQENDPKPIEAKKNLAPSDAFRLILEKIPLIVISILASIHTLIYGPSFLDKDMSGLPSLEILPLRFRIANALFSYVGYMKKMIWPENLAVHYPYRQSFPGWEIVLACVLLGCISVLAVKTLKQHPWFLVGWLWYLGTLVPVIGIVQVGSYAMADRYAYVPLMGLFIVVVWSVPELVKQLPHKKKVLFIMAAVVLAILTTISWKQIGYWKSSNTLFEHALKVAPNNAIAHHNLGEALNQQGRTAEAIAHYVQALRIKPDYADVHINLGNSLDIQGRTAEAIAHYLQALRIKPNSVDAHNNLGVALIRKGDIEGAVAQFRKALQLDPDNLQLKHNLKKAVKIQQRNQ